MITTPSQMAAIMSENCKRKIEESEAKQVLEMIEHSIRVRKRKKFRVLNENTEQEQIEKECVGKRGCKEYHNISEFGINLGKSFGEAGIFASQSKACDKKYRESHKGTVKIKAPVAIPKPIQPPIQTELLLEVGQKSADIISRENFLKAMTAMEDIIKTNRKMLGAEAN